MKEPDKTRPIDFLDDLVQIPRSYYGFIFHYYRAEVYRETNWRNRLDTTTNWAIVVTAAMLTFAFSDEMVPHTVILVNYFLVWFLLYIEARRFRYYWLLRGRTRLIEKRLLSQVFSGKKKEADKDKWKEKLAGSFLSQKISMSRLESVAWRLRRSYFFLIPLIFLCWIVKTSSYPYPAGTLQDFFFNARLWFVPGFLVFFLLLLSILAAALIAFYIPRKRIHADLP